MTAISVIELQDVQSRPDHRHVVLDEVGIVDLRVPVQIVGRDGEAQSTVASFEMTVEVPAEVKGTHMSRFVESLQTVDEPFTAASLGQLTATVKARLAAPRALVRMSFPYFLAREAPVSGLSAPLDYEGRLSATVDGRTEIGVGLRAPVSSLCPCSKEISDYGAHNQRGYVEIEVKCPRSEPVWLEDLIEIAERSASAPMHPLLKRVDERHVTMQAYENPAFVEDIAREAAVALRDDPRVERYRVRVTNLESIHSHNAVATVTGKRA